MAAPRASSFKVLRNLQKVSRSTPGRRELHITGAQGSPSPIDAARKNLYIQWNLQDLRSECQKRSLGASGTTHELIDRLAGHDSLQARAFSMAMRRISHEQTRKPISGPPEPTARREFNTSRALKAVGDSSTVDFAYLPKLFEEPDAFAPAAIRVPILPHIESDDAEAVLEKFPELDAAAGGYQDTTGHATLMKAEISALETGSASAMSDVHDGHHGAAEMTVEMLTALTDTVGKSAQQFVETMKGREEGTIRQLWQGLLDDVLGPRKK